MNLFFSRQHPLRERGHPRSSREASLDVPCETGEPPEHLHLQHLLQADTGEYFIITGDYEIILLGLRLGQAGRPARSGQGEPPRSLQDHAEGE